MSRISRFAPLMRQVRQEHPNHLPLDNGDTVQGSLGDYEATVQPVSRRARLDPNNEVAVLSGRDPPCQACANHGNHGRA